MKLETRALGNRIHILVAAAGEIHEHDRIARERWRKLRRVGKRMRGFERWNDSLDAAASVKCRECFFIGDRHILGATAVLQPRMLGTDARIVETGRHGM